MPFEAGQQLLHYRLIEKLGEGGMGVVWKAEDTTLDRTVAIKVLPETFTTDPDRLSRFEREAKSLAALNDPHIAGIYGLHEHEGLRFIAMEYVEGEDLAQRLQRGALPVDEATNIARTVAGALSTAHGSGVVHRDLKPANVMLTTDGKPKVLDFGLAKAVAPDSTLSGAEPASISHSPTVTSFGTMAGVILGTAAYMSPEQARGNPVDRRADVWALGVMLYEMLTGRPAFAGDTVSDTLAAVLKTEPDWEALPAATPRAVRRVLRRCLVRDPQERMHDAADVRLELAHAFDEDDALEGGAGATASRVSRGLLGVAVALTLIVGAGLGYALRGKPAASTAPEPRVVSTLVVPEGVTVNMRALSFDLSPDGRQLAFIGVDASRQSHLYVRALGSHNARRIEGTQGAATPFWSPDGRELGYHVATRVMRVPVEGGTPQVLAEHDGWDGAWSPAGTVLMGSRNQGALYRVDVGGGGLRPVEGTDGGVGTVAMTPQFLPDGRHFIFQMEGLGGKTQGIYLGELDSGETTRLVDTLFNGAYAAGQLLFVQDGMIMAQPLDVEARKLTGEPRRVAGPVMHQNYPFHAFFSVTESSLVYLRGEQAVATAELVWADREGNELERTGIVGDLYNARLSPDGRRVAVDVSTLETHGDIWVFDLARGSSRRLTRDPIDESRPNWMPDGSRLVFFRVPDLYSIDVDGASGPELILESEDDKSVTDVAADGRHAVFTSFRTGQSSEIRILDLETGEARDWLATEFEESFGRFSPDGRWIAYVSDESGNEEVYVDRFPRPGERFRISSNGGSWPVWSRDGKELFYYSTTNDLMVVPLDMDSERNPIGTAKRLFSPRLRRGYFEVGPDPDRILLTERVDPEVGVFTMVQGWASGSGD
jgi:Tol biopolymer transport system component/predicted Ser/Thr protein kinase